MQEQQSLQNPKTYFELIAKVGSKGPYQRNVFLIFALNWWVSAFLLLGTSFLFMNPKFDCQAHGIKTDNCQETICKMDSSEWSKYLQDPEVYSLATQFGPYLCDDIEQLNALRMTLYIGNFIGYFVFLFITDNYGRKFSLIVTWATTMFGVLILCTSVNMTMAIFGLFFAGAGCQAILRINMAVLGQIVDYYKRQSYSVALEMAFGLAGVLLGALYWLIRHWRYIMIIFCGLPGIAVLLLFIFYMEETPKFLITRHGFDKSIKSLNRIAKINKIDSYSITEQDVKRVYDNQECGGHKFESMIAPWHLLKYKSLRKHTICCSLIFFFMTYLYFGPVVIIDDLGISPFLAQIIVSLSELLAYPFAFWYIQKLPRVKSGLICYALSAVFSGILIFVVPSQDCNKCFEVILQTFLVFASRFIISFYFAIFFLYVTELFPLRVRGLGFGMASAAGSIASASGQFIFQQMQVKQINPMIFFTLFAILSLLTLWFEDQTLNKPLETQIRQIQDLKNEEKTHRTKVESDSNEPNQDSSGEKDSHRNSLRDQKQVEMMKSQSQNKEDQFLEQNFEIG